MIILFFRQYLIHHSVLQGLLGGHPEVALAIGGDFGVGLAGVLCNDAEQLRAEFLNLLGLNQDVGGLALDAAKRLVNHHPGVRQRGALALLPCNQQDGAH